MSAAIALGLAAPASADADDFIDYMSRQGEDVAGVEYEVLNLGMEICDPFESGARPTTLWTV